MRGSDDRVDDRPDDRLDDRIEIPERNAMSKGRGVSLTPERLSGLFHLHKYRMLSIPQFARISGLSYKHATEVLLALEQREVIG